MSTGALAKAGRVDPAAFRRLAGVTMLAAAFLGLVAVASFWAAAGFNIQRAFIEPPGLLGIGSAKVEILRWGALADMLVYLLSIPLFLCVGSELADDRGRAVRVLTTSGVLYATIGSLAAVTLAYAAPPLLHAYTAAAPGGRAGITLAFTTLTNVIYRGWWTTLELIPLGVWTMGTAIILRGRHRGLGTLGLLAGAGAFLSVVGRMTQAPTAVIAVPFALFGLTVIYQVWLAVLLLKGSPLS